MLIPLPTATDDHQRKNAEALVTSGAAEMLLQRDLTGVTLAARILTLASAPARREEIAVAASRLARPLAARVIVDKVLELAGDQEGPGSRFQVPGSGSGSGSGASKAEH